MDRLRNDEKLKRPQSDGGGNEASSHCLISSRTQSHVQRKRHGLISSRSNTKYLTSCGCSYLHHTSSLVFSLILLSLNFSLFEYRLQQLRA
jgi:hypothetical protein